VGGREIASECLLELRLFMVELNSNQVESFLIAFVLTVEIKVKFYSDIW
jgi:hypothetical protein